MAKAPLKHLQTVAEQTSSSPSAKALSKAFELFTKETVRLEEAYAELKKQFNTVNLKLEISNQKLQQKVSELDFNSYYLNSILSNISQGILFIDLKGDITTYNDAAEMILEKESDTVLFQNFWLNFPDELFGFSIRQALSNKKAPLTTFTHFTSKNGSQRDLEIDTTFALNKSLLTQHSSQRLESMQGIIILIRDITEIRRLQMAANRNDRLKELGEMAAMVAHEIRNPLGGIKGFASLLERDLQNQPELQKMASYIVEGTHSLNNLVTRVLNYSRPLQLEIELTDIVALGKELLQQTAADAALGHGIEMKIDALVSPLMISIDSQLIRSALLNLIVNAIQAMPLGGNLVLKVIPINDFVQIQVIDTGIGIPKENLEKLFSPFFTTKEEGNGFGLAEVYKVVQLHGGTIEVSSTLGKGTTFTVKLPLKMG